LKVLSVTGGVPRYLEEIRPSLSAEENIRRLCFTKEGFLFNEFDQIFHDMFSQRSATYREIVNALAEGSKRQNEVGHAINWERGGHLTEYLRDLELSGFVTADIVYGIKTGKPTRLSKYRLSDNYIRFYLKCIAPRADAIKKGLYDSTTLEGIIPWETVIGLQFENLVLKNLPFLLTIIGVHPSAVKAAAPYIQNPTGRQRGCQIDLLIHARHSIYICEIKSAARITAAVIDEVKQKVLRLAVPKGISTRTVLIHAGDIEPAAIREGFFDHLVPFDNLLTASRAA
jgi:hypothetical protein